MREPRATATDFSTRVDVKHDVRDQVSGVLAHGMRFATRRFHRHATATLARCHEHILANRRGLAIGLKALLGALAFWLAFLIRFDFRHIPPKYMMVLLRALPFAVLLPKTECDWNPSLRVHTNAHIRCRGRGRHRLQAEYNTPPAAPQKG